MRTRTARPSLASYVPALVLRRFARTRAPLNAPASERQASAVLFADISGFTALTERLADQGPQGIEALTGILNTYFGRLVDAIADHGGDIVKFAGDALIALWPVADESGQANGAELALVTARAARCALAVQAALHGYTTDKGERLSLKIAIGAGELLAVHVGGELRRWELVLAGAPLRDVGGAGAHCAPGAVVLTPAAFGLLGARGQGDALADGVVRLASVQLDAPIEALAEVRFEPGITPALEQALFGYIPGAIRSRLQGGQDVWLAELRRLTVIFATLPGHDGSMPLAQSQALVTSLQTILYHYEGSLNKLSVDDKGVSLLAAFGLPPLAHEDDAVRGIKAALDMQAKFQELGWQSSIGVTSGRVFCGVVGSPRRCEYTMMGDVVNLAARLMVAAKGSVLCDEPTFKASRAQHNFAELAPLTLKGKKKPVPVYSPRGQTLRHTRLRTSTLVGRERERALLAARIEALARGESGVVVIEGEAGIGKSRLLDEAHDIARHDVIVLLGAADAIEKSTPYQAWRGVFTKLLDLEGVALPAERREHVLARLGSDPRLLRLAPLLDAVVPLDLPDNDDTRQMSGEVRADNTRNLLVELLRREAALTPLLVSLEDLHWMDSASFALVRLVVRDVEPVLLVLSTRPLTPLQTPADYRTLLTAPGTLHLLLESLDPVHAIQLVCQRLGVRCLPPEVEQLIVAKAHGNPFFTEELAYAMRDAGLLEIEGGECRARAGTDLLAATIPDTVQGVVTQRIDRLEPVEQLALKVASVIGRVFTVTILRDVFPLDDLRPRLERHLESLRSLDLTSLEAPKPDIAYIFKHIITQEVTYNLMLFAQRRELHRSVARWYEEAHAADLAPYYALLAHHWSKAEERERAVGYYEKAGEEALRGFASGEAIEFFGQAMRLDAELASPSDAQRRARWERLTGEAHYALGDSRKSAEHLRRAMALLGFPVPESLVGALLAVPRQALAQTGHRVLPRRFIGRAGLRREFFLEAARGDERLTQLQYMANNTPGTLLGGLRALNLAEKAGPSPELARTLANMSVVICGARAYGLARLYERRALATLEGMDDPPCRAYVLEVTGLYRVGMGHWPEARELLTPAIEIAERFADHRRWEECVFIRAHALFRTGEIAWATRDWERIHASGQTRGVLQMQVWGLGGVVGGLLRSGCAAGRASELAELLAARGRDRELLRADVIYGHGWLAAAHWRAGRVEPALAAADVVGEQTSLLEMTAHYLLEGFGGAAEVYLSLWEREPERAARLRARARRMSRALANFALIYPMGKPLARLRGGTLAWLEGRHARAERAWRRCIADARRLVMPAEEAQAHVELGRHLPQGAPERERHLAQARAIFARIGAAAELERVAALGA